MKVFHRLALIPVAAGGWYADRFARSRHALRRRPEEPSQAGGWALAEIIFMSLSLGAVALVIALSILRFTGATPPPWLMRYLLPPLLAGAVGYLTNLVAVTMLFRPYDRDDAHPAGLVPFWRQGLLPRNKDELARVAGKNVSQELLTPETIAEELGAMVDAAFEDERLQESLSDALGPVIREKTPAIVAAATPKLMSVLRGMIARGFTNEKIDLLFARVIDPWLADEENRERLAEEICDIMQDLAPRGVEWMQEMAKRYKRAGVWKRLAVWTAERTRALDWDEVREQLLQWLRSEDAREQIRNELPRLVAMLRDALRDPQAAELVAGLRHRASGFVVDVTQEHLEAVLPDLGHEIADDKRFWRWLATEGAPSLRPSVMAYLHRGGLQAIREKFDVAGRVEAAINGMRFDRLHEKIDEASARHLGAIQVLGYVLGLGAGSLLMLL